MSNPANDDYSTISVQDGTRRIEEAPPVRMRDKPLIHARQEEIEIARRAGDAAASLARALDNLFNGPDDGVIRT